MTLPSAPAALTSPAGVPRAPLTKRDLVIIPLVLASLITAGVLAFIWAGRHAIAIDRLTRGVGDTVFYTADGKPWFALDEQRRDVPLKEIAADLRNAVIAVEDHRFRYHPGIDPLGLARAVVEDIKAASVVEGGSTITQQLARILFLSNAQTFARKAQEAYLALMLETRLTKDQILELYLNRVYLGASAYGVEKMSQQLFGKSASKLSLAESATIAGLIRRPSGLSPWSNYDGARERSHVVLSRMREEGYITAKQEAAARSTPVRIRPYPQSERAEAGYAKEYLRQQFRAVFGGDHPPDWKVKTSFVASLQTAAERAVARGLGDIPNKNVQAALVAMRVSDGRVVALVGGRDYSRSEFDRATRSRRQPGSAFKPLVYAAALERGYTPVTMLPQPTNIPVEGNPDWKPRNVGYSSDAELSLRQAIIESNNRAAVGVQQAIGTQRVLSLTKAAGLEDLPDVPSLALGVGLVSPIQLTAAFAMFPNGGFAVEPHAILDVTDAQDTSVWEEEPKKERAISPETAFQMVTLLADVIDRGTGTGARLHGVRFPAGGKTGTTNDFQDAWFVGFTSSLVVGVWVGFDTPASMGQDASGSRYALPIWSNFMVQAARVYRPDSFLPPAGMQEELFCSISYKRASTNCPAYYEYFKEDDDIPGETCDIHRGQSRVARVVSTVRRWLERIGGIFRD